MSIYLFIKIENAALFSPFFHQNLNVEQLFPICFSAFFAGNAPEVFPDFVVEGIDFGGLGVGNGAAGGTVHSMLLSAYKLYKRRCFKRLSKTTLLYTIRQEVRLTFFSNASKVNIFFTMTLY